MLKNSNFFFLKHIAEPLSSRTESNDPAFCIAGKTYSYSQLWRYVGHVRELVAGFEDKLIGLYATDDIRTYASILALWTLGKAYVPLNPNQPVARHRDVMNNTNSHYILSSDSKYNVGIDGVTTICTASDEFAGDERLGIDLFKSVEDSEVAYIIFTSGSTGKPKGVPVTRGNVAAFINSMENIGLDVISSDRCLQPFDLTFDFSVSSYLVPLVNGACIYTVPPKSVKFLYIASLIEDYHLTVLQMVPSMMRNLLPYLDELDLSSVRYNIFCGEALLASNIQLWHRRNPGMVTYNMYGPTEDTVFCTYYLIDSKNSTAIESNNDIVSIGKDFPNSISILIDDNGNVISECETQGELCLAGPQLTPGYWNNEQENSSKFFDLDGRRYYRSGDICYYSSGNDLMYVSRKDFQVKINGFRVELGEIENVFSKVSGGRYAVVVPFVNKQGNTELAIAVEGKEYDWTEHRQAMEAMLPKYEIPSRCVFVRSMPLNQNGKVDRNRISELLPY